MRKIGSLFAIILLIFTLGVSASAATAPSMNTTATAANDGSCQINMTLTLQINSQEDLLYPLPAGATAVKVNGSRASTTKEGDTLSIDLRRHLKNASGAVSVNIQYTLHDLVHKTNYGTLELSVPLLSGFAYPIEEFHFSVILPGKTEQRPAFSSGYHQAAIEQHLTYTVEGTAITGNNLKTMKDHETLVMTLPVERAMFPNAITEPQTGKVSWTGMGICAGLALIYWLLFLYAIPRRQRCTEVPQGVTAGQVAALAGSGGVDLTMLVFSWAELGYILIQTQKNRVLLHKRMEMGNERSEFEQRTFRNLFGSRLTLDATGSRYAALAADLARKHGGISEMFHKRTGNPLFFRVLWAVFGMFAGGGIGTFLGKGALLQGFLVFLLGLLGLCSGYGILTWTDCGLFRYKRHLLAGLLASVAWLLLGIAGGAWAIGLVMCLALLGAGLLYGWCGKRTDLGNLTAGQLLGLRKYLKGGDKLQLERAKNSDPDYFFRMIPYAIALGVGKGFARAMGRKALEGNCPYLATGKPGNALQWYERLERIIELMDQRKKTRTLEKVVQTVQRFTKP